MVDVLGLLLAVMVHAAGSQDRDGATQVLRALVARFPGLQLIWADGGYAGKLVAWVAHAAADSGDRETSSAYPGLSSAAMALDR